MTRSIWRATGTMLAARDQIRLAMQPRQEALSNAVARLLVANNESEERAAAQRARNLRSRAAAGVFLSHGNARGDLLTVCI